MVSQKLPFLQRNRQDVTCRRLYLRKHSETVFLERAALTASGLRGQATGRESDPM